MLALQLVLGLGLVSGRPPLLALETEGSFAQALVDAPLLLIFFYKRDGEDVEGGAATLKLAADVEALGEAFPGHVAAVDCARLPGVCAQRLVTVTPAFKLWRNGMFKRYTGPQDGLALRSFLQRKIGGPQPAGGRPSRPEAGPAGRRTTASVLLACAVSAYGVVAMLAELLGLSAPVLLTAIVVVGVLWGLFAVYLLGVHRRNPNVLRVQRNGEPVSFDGGSGWLVLPGAAAGRASVAAEMPAVLLLAPLARTDKGLRKQQRAACERVAVRLGARGFRCLLVDMPPHASALGQAVATIAAAVHWLRHAPDSSGTRSAVPARVGAIGIGEGGQLLARAARLGACPVDCCVLFELGGQAAADAAATVAAVTSAPRPSGKAGGARAGSGGAVAVLSAALTELAALSSGSRVPVQLHFDLVDGPLSGRADGALAGSEREMDARAHAAAKLRAAGAALGGSGAPGPSTSRVFLYGEPQRQAQPEKGSASEGDADADLLSFAVDSAHSAALPMLLQPDGRRELAKGYAWMRMLPFLHFHLAR